MEIKQQRVLFTIPTYLYQCHSGLLGSMAQITKNHQVQYSTVDSSAQCVVMNAVLIQALEAYEQDKLDWLLIWHSDIVPEPWFLDKMLDIAEEKKADLLAAVVPIKDEKGLTSTALDEPVGEVPQEWRVRRLTMSEVLGKEPVNGQKLEKTFTLPNLLLNTGLLLIRMSAPFVDKIRFHFDDQIIRVNGRRRAVVMPEDWNFSRDARKLGCTSIWATTEVRLEHKGQATYPNYQAWGWKTDAEPKYDKDITEAAAAADKIQGWMAWEELAYLATKAKAANTVVELGSWKGRSTKAMAMTCKGKIYAVDSWKGSTNGDATGVEADERGRETIKGEFFDNVATEHRNVIPIDCEHAFAGTALKHLAGSVDYQFIDGDHAYEHVKRDIKTALTLAAPGGIISGHDLNEEAVKRACDELLPGYSHVVGSIWEYRVPALKEALA